MFPTQILLTTPQPVILLIIYGIIKICLPLRSQRKCALLIGEKLYHAKLVVKEILVKLNIGDRRYNTAYHYLNTKPIYIKISHVSLQNPHHIPCHRSKGKSNIYGDDALCAPVQVYPNSILVINDTTQIPEPSSRVP